MFPCFILVRFENIGLAYQDVDARGNVTCYRSYADGTVLFEQPPVGEACWVEPIQTPPTWSL